MSLQRAGGDADLRRCICSAGHIIAGAILAVAARPALAVDQVHDEIQVYNAEIAEVGQWTYEQHLNYALVGHTSQRSRAASSRITACRARRSSPTG